MIHIHWSVIVGAAVIIGMLCISFYKGHESNAWANGLRAIIGTLLTLVFAAIWGGVFWY